MDVFALWLPTLLSAIVLFFLSFLSWMVLQLHKQDWKKLESEEEVLTLLRQHDVPLGSYMIPGCDDPKEMQSEEYQKKYSEGPRGVMTLFPAVNMGRNLLLTFLLFLLTSFTLGYLASIAFAPGASFMTVFRFIATGGLLAYLISIVQHSVWFRCRIVGHVVEAIVYSLVTGAIFASLWPAAV